MSDSFANLWNTSAGTGPKPAQRTLGGAMAAQPASAAGTGVRRPGPDAFSILAASSKPTFSSTPATRSQTPASTSSAPPSKPPSRGSNDAFSTLLGGSGKLGAGNEAGMSMAQRAAKAEADRRAALERQQAASKKQSAAWAGLDALGSTSIPAAGPVSPSNDDDDWLFGSVTSPASTRSPPSTVASPAPAKSTSQADDWGLDDFISAPAKKPSASSSTATASKSTKPTGSFWDLDALDSAPAPAVREAPSRSRTPGDFDFGDREDRPSIGDSGDEEDILGVLGRPASGRRPSPRTKATPAARSGRNSPLPHLIGQIVEMGYTLEQARVALAATDSGEDVQAAIEILLSGGTSEPTPAPSNGASRPARDEDDGWGDAPRRRFNYDDDEDEAPPRRAPPRNPASPPTTSPPAARPGISRNNSSTRQGEGEGIQTDKIIAQASEIGLSVFNRANALWKSGKEQAKKLYEEQQAARAAQAASSSAPPRKDGRPKWMQDAVGEDGEGAPPTQRRRPAQEAPAFADDDAPAPAAQRRPRPSPGDSSPAAVPPTGDLFSDAPAEPPARQYRRRHSPPRTRNTPTAPAQVPRTQAPPSAPTLKTRQTILATPAAIAASDRHKSSGTEMFKLGRYAEAESSYTSAISTLPSNHLLLIPLLNNRAAARFKIGDTSGAIDDSTTVINLVGVDYRPGSEKKVERKEEGAGVDLALGLVKAWKRRAESYEGREKWAEALADWEKAAGCDFAGALRREGLTGAARCRKAIAPPPKPTAPKPKPKPAALSRPPARPAPPSEAASRLKQANAEAEAEDNAKHELKDSVEARITAWKGGKETNIRALISSLENVLWPELGWVKVGMGELLTPSQVKIRYTKAIAKLHPDKLNARNTTVEQRMIANGVFSALNDAWNAFQQAS
ncbi:hypothetical protein PENSPDRAFT_757490 [Peniophora sp. CONT]|nr:hypothetical protein PENSPDRAFT_757490 [Peniophora sp. CONT]